MRVQKKLFLQKNPYVTKKYTPDFVKTVKEQVAFHREHCLEYADILEEMAYDPDTIHTENDLWRIPPISTLYLKRNRLFCMEESRLAVTATSSGTQGSQSLVGLDKGTLVLGIAMMIRFFSYHHVISPIPVQYIVLGYEPSTHNSVGAAKTAYGTTKFAPALRRTYALKDNGTGYDLNIQGVQDALLRAAKWHIPVRFVGFPAYMYFLVKQLEENNLSLHLNHRSKILLGGGWKQFSAQEIDRSVFYALLEKTLGLGRENCLEFFSAVEHPLPYCKCAEGHFHLPVYSRVFVRDPSTLQPVKTGEAGLLNLISPFVASMPLVSIVTDDIAVAGEANSCGCGNPSPWFSLLGRAGVAQIKTCSASAADLLNGVGK